MLLFSYSILGVLVEHLDILPELLIAFSWEHKSYFFLIVAQVGLTVKLILVQVNINIQVGLTVKLILVQF
mgnify:CR=1 FL=1